MLADAVLALARTKAARASAAGERCTVRHVAEGRATKLRVEQIGEMLLKRIAAKGRRRRDASLLRHGVDGHQTLTDHFVTQRLAAIVGIPPVGRSRWRFGFRHRIVVVVARGVAVLRRLMITHTDNVTRRQPAVLSIDRADVESREHRLGGHVPHQVVTVRDALREDASQPREDLINRQYRRQAH